MVHLPAIFSNQCWSTARSGSKLDSCGSAAAAPRDHACTHAWPTCWSLVHIMSVTSRLPSAAQQLPLPLPF